MPTPPVSPVRGRSPEPRPPVRPRSPSPIREEIPFTGNIHPQAPVLAPTLLQGRQQASQAIELKNYLQKKAQEQAAHKQAKKQYEEDLAAHQRGRLAAPGPGASEDEKKAFAAEQAHIEGSIPIPGEREGNIRLQQPKAYPKPEKADNRYSLPPLPASETASSTAYTQRPYMYHQANKDLLEEGARLSNRPFERPIDQKGAILSRVAPRSNDQERILEASQALNAPQVIGAERLGEHAQGHGRYNLEDIRGHLGSHEGRSLTPTLQELTNPHEQRVIDEMQERAQHRLNTEILPRLKSVWGSSGQRRSGDWEKQVAKLLMDTERDVRHESNALRHQNFRESMGLAEQRQAREQAGSQNMQKIMHGAHHTEAEREINAAQAANEQARNQFQQHVQQLNFQNLTAALKTAHNQAERDAAMKEWERQMAHPWQMLQNYNALVNSQTPASMHQVEFGSANVPTPYNQQLGLGSLLGQVGSSMLGNQGKLFAKGGHVTAPAYDVATNPYLPQSMRAREAEAEHYEKPIGGNMVGHVLKHMFRGLGQDPRDPMKVFYQGAAGGFDAYDAEQAADRQNQAQSLALRAKMADTLREEARYDREQKRQELKNEHEHAYHMGDLDIKRQALNRKEGRDPEEAALEKEYKRAQIESLRGKNAPSEITIGGKTITPKTKLGLTPQDAMKLREIEKRRLANEEKGLGYTQMLGFLNTNKPSTGVIAKYTPNFSDTATEYNRHLKKMVAGELPSGVLTNAKLAFAEGLKPSELDSRKKVKKFAEVGAKHFEDLTERDKMAEDFAAYNIPPRITFAAFDQWNKGGRKGDLVDYVKSTIEGEAVPEEHGQTHDLNEINKELAARGVQ